MFRNLVLRVSKVRSSLPSSDGTKCYDCWRAFSASAISRRANIDQAGLHVTLSSERRQGVKSGGLEGGSQMLYPGLNSQSLLGRRGECGMIRRFSNTSNSSSEENGQKSDNIEAASCSSTDEGPNQEKKANNEGEESVEGDIEPIPEGGESVIDEDIVEETVPKSEEEEVNGIRDEITRLVEEVSRLETELGDAKSKTSFLAGEIEVVRHIAARDAENGKKFAVQKFAKSLLDVADNLERAVSAVPEEEKAVQGTAMLLEGVKMTQEALQKAFRAHGINRYGESGDVFDPHLHDALYTYEDKEAKDGTIGKVLKPGYTLQGRVLRAAQVGTVKMKSG